MSRSDKDKNETLSIETPALKDIVLIRKPSQESMDFSDRVSHSTSMTMSYTPTSLGDHKGQSYIVRAIGKVVLIEQSTPDLEEEGVKWLLIQLQNNDVRFCRIWV